MSKRFLTIEDVADQIGLEYRTVYRLVRDGQIPAAQVGRQYRISQEDLEAYFEQQKRQVAMRANVNSDSPFAPQGTTAEAASGVAQAPPAHDPTRPVSCAACHKTLHSALSIGGNDQLSGLPICQACWGIKGIRQVGKNNDQDTRANGQSSVSRAVQQVATNPELYIATMVRRFGERLSSIDLLEHPTTGQTLELAKARTKHDLGKVKAKGDTLASHHSRFSLKWGGWGKPKSALTLECRCVLPEESRPIDAVQLGTLIESVAEEAGKQPEHFHALLLSSPYGFSNEAVALLKKHAGQDKHLAVVLHDGRADRTHLEEDGRLNDLLPLLSPSHYDGLLDSALTRVRSILTADGSLSMKDAVHQLSGNAKLARDVFKKLGEAPGHSVDVLENIGEVLSVS